MSSAKVIHLAPNSKLIQATLITTVSGGAGLPVVTLSIICIYLTTGYIRQQKGRFKRFDALFTRTINYIDISRPYSRSTEVSLSWMFVEIN